MFHSLRVSVYIQFILRGGCLAADDVQNFDLTTGASFSFQFCLGGNLRDEHSVPRHDVLFLLITPFYDVDVSVLC